MFRRSFCHCCRFPEILCLLAALAFVPNLLSQNKPLPSSHIVSIDARRGVVSATVNATGENFQFTVNNPAQVSTLKIGESVYANFTTRQVSVDDKTPFGTIVSLGTAKGQLTLAPPSKAPSPAPASPTGTSSKSTDGTTSRAAVPSAHSDEERTTAIAPNDARPE